MVNKIDNVEILEKIRYPQIGEYGEGSIPQECYDKLKNTVEKEINLNKLTNMSADIFKNIIFITSNKNGIVFLSAEEKENEQFVKCLVFAIGTDVFFPKEGEESLEDRLTNYIQNILLC